MDDTDCLAAVVRYDNLPFLVRNLLVDLHDGIPRLVFIVSDRRGVADKVKCQEAFFHVFR